MKYINFEEYAYLDLLQDIINFGNHKEDRTGVGTKSLFGKSLSFDLRRDTLPLLTTKKLHTRGIIEELLFFIRGDTQTKKLEEKGINIWKGNTSREFLDSRGLYQLEEGDMGEGYGWQWRHADQIDQLQNVVDGIRNDPHSRRHIVNAWNVNELDRMALPPCHCMFQFYVDSYNLLHCQMYMRSCDLGLGLPYNIASYSILTHLIAKITGYAAGKLIVVIGDAHIYDTHLDGVSNQIKRIPYEFPTLNILKDIKTLKDIESLLYSDLEINNYKCHPKIYLQMAI